MRTGIAQAVGDSSTTAWLWFGGVALVLLARLTTSASLVPSGQRRVVTRRGRVRRVVERGIAWRVPLLERFELVLSTSHDLPVGVRARTIDGVPVLVLVETVVTLLPPEGGQQYADPWPAAEEDHPGRGRHAGVAAPRWSSCGTHSWPGSPAWSPRPGPRSRRSVSSSGASRWSRSTCRSRATVDPTDLNTDLNMVLLVGAAGAAGSGRGGARHRPGRAAEPPALPRRSASRSARPGWACSSRTPT